jgi:hypothetical protein
MIKLIILAILAILAGYGWGYVDTENVDWGFLLGLFIFWALPGLLTIIGILWFVGLLFKISRKLDE